MALKVTMKEKRTKKEMISNSSCSFNKSLCTFSHCIGIGDTVMNKLDMISVFVEFTNYAEGRKILNKKNHELNI